MAKYVHWPLLSGKTKRACLLINVDQKVFSSYEHIVLRVRYCDHAVSIVRCVSSVVLSVDNCLLCVHPRGHIFSPVFMKLGQNVCPMTFRTSLKFGHVGLKTRALGQIILTHQQQAAFENIVEKGEIARNKQFLFFPTMFLTQSDNCSFVCPYF